MSYTRSIEVCQKVLNQEDKIFEIVERKGLGHPDALSDRLAEKLFVTYANFTKENLGAVLRHQFDKLTFMCGKAEVYFGGGKLIEPIRVLVNGRVSARLGNTKIPIKDIIYDTCHHFFKEEFPGACIFNPL